MKKKHTVVHNAKKEREKDWRKSKQSTMYRPSCEMKYAASHPNHLEKDPGLENPATLPNSDLLLPRTHRKK